MLAERLARIRADIARAALGRPITLVAASKFQPLSSLLELYALGVRNFGENYPQALAERAQAMHALGLAPRWHLLGGLQRNKAKLVAPWVDVVHALDGEAVAAALSTAAQNAGRTAPIEAFVQVRLSDAGGHTRRGVDASEAAALGRALRSLPGLRLVGLMGLAARDDAAGQGYAALAALSARLSHPGGPWPGATALSMGMSDDFSLAIARGATVVRIGSALFGPRPQARP